MMIIIHVSDRVGQVMERNWMTVVQDDGPNRWATFQRSMRRRRHCGDMTAAAVAWHQPDPS